MNIKRTTRLSAPEWLGILLMIAGVLFGLYVAYLSTHNASTGERKARSMNLDGSLSEIRTSYMGAMLPTFEAARLIALSRTGGYVFLTGLGLFVVAKRRRWNATLPEVSSERIHEHEV
jgi:arginine exporter protein ArgO